jgi:hypothetical protein
MKLDLPAPEILAAEGVVPEDTQAFGEQSLDVGPDSRIEPGLIGGRTLLCPLLRKRAVANNEGGCGREGENEQAPARAQ